MNSLLPHRLPSIFTMSGLMSELAERGPTAQEPSAKISLSSKVFVIAKERCLAKIDTGHSDIFYSWRNKGKR